MHKLIKTKEGEVIGYARDREAAKKACETLERAAMEVGAVREFTTGATRSPDSERYDPEGFLSPLVIERFSEYMHKHRKQSDGTLRDSDNWQKGMPLPSYAKGMWRHFLHFWMRHRGWETKDAGAAATIEEDLCAIIFNAQGYLHTLLKEQQDA